MGFWKRYPPPGLTPTICLGFFLYVCIELFVEIGASLTGFGCFLGVEDLDVDIFSHQWT